MNESIAKIYKNLGPFNFFLQKAENEELADTKTMIKNFEKRKTGTLFRGEINSQSEKPDGKGFKIFQNGSMYEGYFQDGKTHGIGRGISSKGDTY